MFKRYAIFYTPEAALAEWGAAWLGWDSRTGSTLAQPDIDGLDLAPLTRRPRSYGFHGTLKAPFRLVEGSTQADLLHHAQTFAANHAPFSIGRLALQHHGGFLALRPESDVPELHDFAAAVVKAFDPFRAPLTEAEISRRRASRLSPRQDQHMLDWGYPYIFEDFNFHLTLSGRVPADTANKMIAALTLPLAAVLPHPFQIDALTVTGEDENGMFHQISRYTLSGRAAPPAGRAAPA